MNYCHDHHAPMYKITYNPTKFDGKISEWFVCDKCFGKQEFFGESKEIESIIPLGTLTGMRHNIDQLSLMTRTMTTKLKHVLVVQ